MAGRVPEHVIRQIARGVDFLRLAERHMRLQKRGGRYWALCPFHNEKTPSFTIDPENGLYHCFGCKEGGSVFTFLQKMEGLSFGEALTRLAAEAGVDLSVYRAEEGSAPGELSRMRELMELAATFYQKCLAGSHGGKAVQDYVARRGISAESVEQWRLGYAPDGWEHFIGLALKRKFDPELVARAGLAKRREGASGYYDAFRNRLMFPIGDTTGRTIAFGARALTDEDQPKYLNSPETPLFSKRRCFFGLDKAKTALRTSDSAVVLEGYTDVIMAHQAGVAEAVAVLGTALSEEHARTLRRLVRRVVLLFDADQAGESSAARSIEVLLNEDLDVQVARLPAGNDPCDYIVAQGGEEFRKRLAESRGFFEFRLELARGKHDTATVAGRSAAFDEVAGLAVALRDAAKREMVVRYVAQELGVSSRSVWAYLEKAEQARTPQGPARTNTEGATLSAGDALPGELLGLLLASPELVEEAAERVDLDLLKEGPEREALARLLAQAGGKGRVSARDFLSSLPEPELASAASRALAEEQERSRAIRESTPRERLDGYADYLAQKRQEAEAAGAPAKALDDDGLRDIERRLKERDHKSAQQR